MDPRNEQLGKDIISKLRKQTDEAAQKYNIKLKEAKSKHNKEGVLQLSRDAITFMLIQGQNKSLTIHDVAMASRLATRHLLQQSQKEIWKGI